MIGHYVFVFHALRGGYGGLSKLPDPVYPELIPYLGLGISNFSYGAFGVAVFFLVSGFVIPFSLEKFSKHRFGFFGFLIARVFRLWPVYVVGFAISMLFRWLSFKDSTIVDTYTSTDLWMHVTLFRDWLGGISLDGIVWTLEIEIKFYILSALFAAWTLKGRPYLGVLAAALALVGAYYGVKFPQGWNPPSNFLYAFKFILFMTIGTQFYLLRKGVITGKFMAWYMALAMGVFLLTAPAVVRESYLLALMVFTISYLCRDSFGDNKVIGFFADISYPMYAMHAVFGYVTMRAMIDVGVSKYAALIIQMVLTTSIAYMIHRFVESPTTKFGSRLAMKFVSAVGSRGSDQAVLVSSAKAGADNRLL